MSDLPLGVVWHLFIALGYSAKSCPILKKITIRCKILYWKVSPFRPLAPLQVGAEIEKRGTEREREREKVRTR